MQRIGWVDDPYGLDLAALRLAITGVDGKNALPGTAFLPSSDPATPFPAGKRLGATDPPGMLSPVEPIPEGRREVLRIFRGSTATHMRLRSRILFLSVASITLDAIASVLIYFFERNEAGTGITNIGDSIFWTTTQLLTVSSQLPNPISTPARVLDILLQAWAISAVAVLAGSFGAFFHRRGLERDPIDDSPAV